MGQVFLWVLYRILDCAIHCISRCFRVHNYLLIVHVCENLRMSAHYEHQSWNLSPLLQECGRIVYKHIERFQVMFSNLKKNTEECVSWSLSNDSEYTLLWNSNEVIDVQDKGGHHRCRAVIMPCICSDLSLMHGQRSRVLWIAIVRV